MTSVCGPPCWILLMFLVHWSRSFLPDKYGRMTVNHERMFIGDTVVFHCQITDSSLQASASASDIYVRRAHSHKPVGRVVEQDATSVTINMTVTSVSDTAVYYCTVPTTQGNKIGLGNSVVEVEYPLENVTEFTCVNLEFLKLTCSYKLPVNYRYPQDILGQVLYRLLDYKDAESIVFSGIERTFSLEPGHNLYSEYAFRVRLVYQERGITTTSDDFVVDPMSVGVPATVRHMAVYNVTSTSLDLSWRMPDNVYHYMCNVTYTGTWRDTHETFWQKTKFPRPLTVGSISLHGLTPGTNYALAVQCRTYNGATGEARGYFSNSTTTSAYTIDDVPGVAPRLAPAVSRPSDTGIIVYWEPVAAKDEHGTRRHYVVDISDQHGRHEQRIVGIEESSLLINLRTSEDEVRCAVQAVNNIGTSPASNIWVTPQSQEPEVPNFWVTSHYEETQVVFHWDKMAVFGETCSAFWCEGSLSEMSCQDPINWESMSCDLQNVTIDTGHMVRDQNLLVGFSTSQSSIIWDYCIYVPHKVPLAPLGLKLSETQPSRGIQVEWLPSDCKQDSAYISHYIISYCQGESACTGPIQDELVSRSKTSHVIKDLQPVQYRVTIRAMSHNIRGPESYPVVHKVEEEMNVVAIVLGVSALAVIALAALTVVLIKKTKRICGARIPIQLPTTLPNSEDEATEVPTEKRRFKRRRRDWVKQTLFSFVGRLIPRYDKYHDTAYSQTDSEDRGSGNSGKSGARHESTETTSFSDFGGGQSSSESSACGQGYIAYGGSEASSTGSSQSPTSPDGRRLLDDIAEADDAVTIDETVEPAENSARSADVRNSSQTNPKSFVSYNDDVSGSVWHALATYPDQQLPSDVSGGSTKSHSNMSGDTQALIHSCSADQRNWTEMKINAGSSQSRKQSETNDPENCPYVQIADIKT